MKLHPKTSYNTDSNNELFSNLYENRDFLTDQIITYIGNKRSLLDFIAKGIRIVQKRLYKEKLDIFDVFTGTGIVARHCKQFSHSLIVNDLEKYATITGECYLSNKDDLNILVLKDMYNNLLADMEKMPLEEGIITKLYSPKNDDEINKNDRVFYTRRNAMYIDTVRDYIQSVPLEYQKFFLAPLIAKASVHANTSVRHFHRRDFGQVVLRHFTHLVAVRRSGSAFHLRAPFQQHRRWRTLDDEIERAVGVNRNHHRDQQPLPILGGGVETLHKFADRNLRLPEGGTHRRRGRRLARHALQFDLIDDILLFRHGKLRE